MHKFFAKTQFLGKKVKILTECHSTNSVLRDYLNDGEMKEGSLVLTDYQTGGRGQRGNQWESEPGQNLLMSFYLEPSFLKIQQQHFLNISTSLAINDILRVITGVQIKWPNDMYFLDKKFAGILVENTVYRNSIDSCVIGIGLNVSQRKFQNDATSLSLMGLHIDRWEVLAKFLHAFEHYYELLKSGNHSDLIEEYYMYLRWFREDRTYRSASEGEFRGSIEGIDEWGRLLVNVGGGCKVFDVKEIQFVR